MSEPKYDPPPPFTSEEIAELAKQAAAAGVIMREDWDLPRAIDIIRESQARYAGTFQMDQTINQASLLVEEVAKYGDPTPLGEALMRAGSFLGALVVQGADAVDLTNILAFAGYELHRGGGKS